MDSSEAEQVLRRFRWGALIAMAILALAHTACFALVVVSIKVGPPREGGEGGPRGGGAAREGLPVSRLVDWWSVPFPLGTRAAAVPEMHGLHAQRTSPRVQTPRVLTGRP